MQKQKISKIFTVVWVAVGIVLAAAAYIVGNQTPESRPLLTAFVYAYMFSVPVISIARAIIFRKNMTLTIVLNVLLIIFFFWVLILPLI